MKCLNYFFLCLSLKAISTPCNTCKQVDATTLVCLDCPTGKFLDVCSSKVSVYLFLLRNWKYCCTCMEIPSIKVATESILFLECCLFVLFFLIILMKPTLYLNFWKRRYRYVISRIYIPNLLKGIISISFNVVIKKELPLTFVTPARF